MIMVMGLTAFAGAGQLLKVESMTLEAFDLSAQAESRFDTNGCQCALVKVATVAQNPEFDGNMVGTVSKRKGYYWVYLTTQNPASRELEISSTDYLPIKVTFADYGITRLEAGCTYRLLLSVATSVSVTAFSPRDEPRTKVFANGLKPRWAASVNATQREVLEKLIANMVKVEGGTFTMGATAEQGSEARDDEKPKHDVTLSDYYIGKYEVTQAEWEAVMGERPTSDGDKWTSKYGLGGNYPAYYISWNDCRAFIRKLNELTGLQFKLPTEAQWEYAARGGRSSRGYKYSGITYKLDAVAWYRGNSGNKTHPVGEKPSNELGLHDMSGNVWEWCSDWYDRYSGDSQINLVRPVIESSRVLRGGSWSGIATYCRVACRGRYTVTDRDNYNGMRLAL